MFLVFLLSLLSWNAISVNTFSSKETLAIYESSYPKDELSNNIQSVKSQSKLLSLLQYQIVSSEMKHEAGKFNEIHVVNQALQDWNRQ